MNARSATGLLVVLVVVIGVCSGIYWALGADLELSRAYLIWYIAWWWALTLWVLRDAHERGLPLAFDQGLFVYIAWPVYIPIYLVRSRGWKGILWLALFAGIYGLSIVLAVMAATLVRVLVLA